MASDAPVVPAPTDSTILTQPPTPAPKPPEEVIYPHATPADPVPPPAAPPADPAAPPTTPPAEPKPPTEPAKPADQASPAPAPTDYDLKPPKDSLVSAEEATALTERAKKAGLTQKEAEGLLQERIAVKSEIKAAQDKQLVDARNMWLEQSKNDPEYGGEKLAEYAEKGNRILNRFGPELIPLLKETGMGNHPAVFKFIARLSNLFSEDQLIRGQTGASEGKKAPEEILYGKTTPGVQA